LFTEGVRFSKLQAKLVTKFSLLVKTPPFITSFACNLGNNFSETPPFITSFACNLVNTKIVSFILLQAQLVISKLGKPFFTLTLG